MANYDNDLKLYDEAIKKYKLSVSCKKDYTVVYLNWGNLLITLQKLTGNADYYTEAMQKYKIVIDYESDNIDARYNLAMTLYNYSELINSRFIFEKEILEAFLTSYLLAVIQNKQDLFPQILPNIGNIATKYRNTHYLIIFSVFSLAHDIINNTPSKINEKIELIKQVRETIPEIGVLINTIIDKKPPPDYSEKDNLIEKTAKFLATKIIQKYQR